MHASGRKLWNGLLVLAALLCSRSVSASPGARRAAITESALNPWVSVDAKGNGSTITPVLTTVNGVATTLNAAPPALTATGTAADGLGVTTTSGGAVATQTGGGSYQLCHNMDGDFAPFCKPDNGSSVYVNEIYYVVWDTEYFNANETVLIEANYVNATGGGPQAFQSAELVNSWGHISWTIQSDWLKGLSSNNITLFLTAQGGRSVTGPTVMVTTRAPPPPTYQAPTQAPTGQTLYIALPAVAGLIILCVCGGYIFNRKHRQIGLGNVMGRRRGYGVGKSRRQRLRLGKKKGAIQLREQELTAEGQYRDVPVEQHARIPQHSRGDSDGLASLVATPTEERPSGRNIFRDEMRRQEQERF